MSSSTVTRPRAAVAARTLRRDAWWLEPLITVVVLGGFVVYGTWTALVGRDYFVDPYLSPFYSPCLAANCVRPTWQIVGNWWRVSPALLVLPFPLAFRLTCYYYRKAYYRSFWWAPPACAVPDARARYSGETRFPLILQNVHRYFFYLALPFPLILTWDALRAFNFPDGFGMGLGTLILLVNAALLWLYTLSCHSCRHRCASGCGAGSASSPLATCCSPGSAWWWSPSPTCTCAWSPPARSPI